MARRSDHSREQLRRLALDSARQITAEEGLRGLKARRVAREIGYTIGTIYNVFEDLDDLIVQMNAETLGALYAACSQVDLDGGPHAWLGDLEDAVGVGVIGEHVDRVVGAGVEQQGVVVGRDGRRGAGLARAAKTRGNRA